MTRTEILEKAAEIVAGREETHGAAEDNFAMIAELWSAWKGCHYSRVDVAMMMILLKLARVKSGHGTDDNYVDIIGYAACAAEIAGRSAL